MNAAGSAMDDGGAKSSTFAAQIAAAATTGRQSRHVLHEGTEGLWSKLQLCFVDTRQVQLSWHCGQSR